MRTTLAILVIVLIPSISAAELLGTAAVALGIGSDEKAPHRILPWFVFDTSPSAILFDDMWLDVSHVGTSQVATPTSDPDFLEVAHRLTNGQVENLWIGARLETVGIGDIENEQSWFGLATRDFKGALVDSIVLSLDALSFQDPNEFGGTGFSYEFSVYIYGRGPTVAAEPASWGRIKALYER
ncbi:MAG: hypothetical protein JSW50_09285 [Candidatus Latescibacterota bacterium]|nr:MAG: hypothetical protein JSW50_09285 [Candidatus Latescibacterota bacterium]